MGSIVTLPQVAHLDHTRKRAAVARMDGSGRWSRLRYRSRLTRLEDDLRSLGSEIRTSRLVVDNGQVHIVATAVDGRAVFTVGTGPAVDDPFDAVVVEVAAGGTPEVGRDGDPFLSVAIVKDGEVVQQISA